MAPKGAHGVYRTNSSRHADGKSESSRNGGLGNNRHPKLEISFLVNSGASANGSENGSIARQSSRRSGKGFSTTSTGGAKRFRCESCSATFAQSHDASKHKRTVHEKLRPYRCDICQKTFGEKGNLSKHKKSVHLNERPFSCEQCSSSFAFKDGLQRHRSLVHFDQRPFVCPTCGADFKQISQLRKHSCTKS